MPNSTPPKLAIVAIKHPAVMTGMGEHIPAGAICIWVREDANGVVQIKMLPGQPRYSNWYGWLGIREQFTTLKTGYWTEGTLSDHIQRGVQHFLQNRG